MAKLNSRFREGSRFAGVKKIFREKQKTVWERCLKIKRKYNNCTKVFLKNKPQTLVYFFSYYWMWNYIQTYSYQECNFRLQCSSIKCIKLQKSQYSSSLVDSEFSREALLISESVGFNKCQD